MLTFTDIKPYLNTEKVDISKTTYLNSITQAVSDFVANYTNLIIDADSPKGLIQCVADMVAYHFSIRPDLEEIKSEDMGLVFSTNYPKSISKRLQSYRKLKW